MNYSQHLSSALVAFGSGDEAGALAELDLALAEAGRVGRMVGLKAIDRDMRMAHRDRMR